MHYRYSERERTTLGGKRFFDVEDDCIGNANRSLGVVSMCSRAPSGHGKAGDYGEPDGGIAASEKVVESEKSVYS